MRLIALLLVALVSTQLASRADADITFSIDLDLNTDGIQNSINVIQGDTITGAIVLHVTGDTQFTAYDVIMEFDNASLAFGANTLSGLRDDGNGNRTEVVSTNRRNIGASGTRTGGVAFDLGPLTDDDPLSGPGNRITGIAGGTSGAPLGSPVFNFTTFQFEDFNKPIYEFTLTAIAGGAPTLTLQGAPPNSSGDRADFLGLTNPGAIVYNGASANVGASAVPEPSSFAALSLGAFYFGRRKLRNRKKKNAAEKTAA